MKESREHLFDLMILLVIGFCIFSGIGRFLETQAQASARDRTAIVTLRIVGTEAYLPSSVTAGEGVYLASGETYGSVESIEALPARVEAESEGEILVGVWEGGDLWDTEVEIRIPGAVGESGFLQGGSVAVLVGQHLSLYTEYAYLYGEVTEVRILAGE